MNPVKSHKTRVGASRTRKAYIKEKMAREFPPDIDDAPMHNIATLEAADKLRRRAGEEFDRKQARGDYYKPKKKK